MVTWTSVPEAPQRSSRAPLGGSGPLYLTRPSASRRRNRAVPGVGVVPTLLFAVLDERGGGDGPGK
jgi:hypothetical protein